jgi:hypothetical protein
MKAREVLKDCWAACDLLDVETDPQRFKLLWISAIALLRAVGHVLDKVDGAENQDRKTAITKAWSSWQANKRENKIFWEFIDKERNVLLKEYEVGFMSMNGSVIIRRGDHTGELRNELFCPLSDGEFTGEDCRDVIRDALLWWEVQLKDIEAQIT